MGWIDDDGCTVYYGVDDYKKARKVLDNPNTHKLLRDRIDPTRCAMGKPVTYWFDIEWETQTERLKAYLDTWDVVQEYNIDAIMDFMPEEYTRTVVSEGWGKPGDADYWEGCTHDYREINKEELLELWVHPKGFLGYFEDKLAIYIENNCSLAEAKAFNRLSRPQDAENKNNAMLAEHILTEGLEPPTDSDYQKALARLNEALDTGRHLDCYGHCSDYREQKGLIQAPVEEESDEEETEVYTTCGATRPVGNSITEAVTEPVAEEMVLSHTEIERVIGGLGITDWVDSKFRPMEENNPALYKVYFVLLSPVMFPIVFIEMFLDGFIKGFRGQA